MNIFVYDKSTGRIHRSVQCPSSVAPLHANGVDDYIEVAESVDVYDKWVNNGLLVDRPSMTPTVNGLVITNLPQPCSLTTYGTTYEIDDGEVILSYDLAGEYEVKVEAFPYLDWEVTVEQP